MALSVKSIGLSGIEGYVVEAEADIMMGLPGFSIVGLPDTAVKEAKERVLSSLKASGVMFSAKRLTVNLAPAATRKGGAVFDLPILLSVLLKAGMISEEVTQYAFAGELSLSGDLRGVAGILPMVIAARDLGFRGFFLPAENAPEAACVEGVEIYPAENILQILRRFDTGAANFINSDLSEIALFEREIELVGSGEYPLDFSEVKGQESVKRALEVAAAGGHNVMMIGSPGSGKSMLAKRLPGILPDMSFEEALETTKIYSVAGLLTKEHPMVNTRPFRSPHHTVSAVSLAGGGSMPKPGELSLAHNGVLFLDELPEFSVQALEVLRQPLEDGVVTVSRIGGTVTYPCSVMLVCAMNPCRCGYYGHPKKQCTCSEIDRQRYLKKISGPLLDRLDIHIEVPPVSYDELKSDEKGECSKDIRARVNAARERQLKRLSGTGIYCNAQLTPRLTREVCTLTDQAQSVLRSAFDGLGMSARAHDRILRLARTIADLEGSEHIDTAHIAEAVQYRALDRKYW